MSETSFVSIDIDERSIQHFIVEHLQKNLSEIDNNKIFYTLDDLQQITGMSKGFIAKQFFHDSRFVQIRRKVGRKWLFPVEETREFLNQWISEQPNE